MKIKSKSSHLLALTSAALSMPAFSAAQPVETEISVRTSLYKEENVPRDNIIFGDDFRYDIDIHQFSLLTPVGEKWSLGFNAARESMSGASPWGTVADADGAATLIMSGATISESRKEFSLSTQRYFNKSSLGIEVSRSKENDYEADAIVLSTEWDSDNKLSTLTLGMSYSKDKITPTDAILFGRVLEEEKTSQSYSLGWTQILDKTSVLQSGIRVTKHSGYLTDPYKLRDARPDERLEWSVNFRYRKFIESTNAALHTNYRYYEDSYKVRSHTVETAWYQNIAGNFQLAPNLRYYSQRKASFYLPIDDYTLPLTTNQSSDYRLSTFGAFTVGLKAIYNQPTWAVSFSVENYKSRGKYSLTNAETEHPALLSFSLASIGFDFRF